MYLIGNVIRAFRIKQRKRQCKWKVVSFKRLVLSRLTRLTSVRKIEPIITQHKRKMFQWSRVSELQVLRKMGTQLSLWAPDTILNI